MKEYGSIQYIDFYAEAPDTAAYIVREMGDLTVRLEHYFPPNKVEILKEFPVGSFSESSFEDSLIQCRRIMGNWRKLWVETPCWKKYN